MNALVASAQPLNLIYAGLLKIFGPGIAPIAREFGLGESLKMGEVKACYWPVWRCDAIAEGKVEVRGSGKEGKGWLGVREGYVPGNAFAPLSYLSYAVPPLPDDLPRYNPTKHLRQLGDDTEIVAVPFTVSPMAVIKRIRYLVGRRTWEGIGLDERDWNETMVACYPLFFPIYLAQFEHTLGDNHRVFTVVLDAHDENVNHCRASWPAPPEMIERGRFNNNYYVNPAPFLPTSTFILPSRPPISTSESSDSSPAASPSPILSTPSHAHSNPAEIFSSWLSPGPSSPTIIRPSPLLEIEADEEGNEIPIEWEDPRIQSWSGEERAENWEWFEKAVEVHKGIAALEGLAELSAQLPEGADPKGMVISRTPGQKSNLAPRPMSEIRRQLSNDVERMKGELEEGKPGWLRRFERGLTGEEAETAEVQEAQEVQKVQAGGEGEEGAKSGESGEALERAIGEERKRE
ncbi:hypothetical protein EHS25_009089 [Saitozyma podzolica]|uniref:Uncharacterized protein n=1 Tax=Saitozyma podzolica TaxID=1890683 RepID=A0A427YKX1_9TREE|nr:hypothetical protein EHS25_009089 [Saitozyma podzolica]